MIGEDVSYTLSTAQDQTMFTQSGGRWIVRRLTPTECERLQGFPDGYTDLGGTPDARRYKQIGNSMAVPVMLWLGRRIDAYDALHGDEVAMPPHAKKVEY